MPRKLKSQDGNPYEAIRGLWEGAYVSQFIRLFQGKFGFPSITVWDLEDSLVDGSSVLVPDVCARLLRFLTAKKDTLIENFETTLYNLVNKEKGGPLQIQDRLGSWKELSPENKLSVLKWLVDHVYKKKEDDLAEYLDENYSSDDLRGICVGQDAFNSFYWYLDDLRLYRENSFKKPNKKEWECVCVSLADWQSFLKQFRKTSNIQERELHTYLNFQLFPLIESQLKDLESKKKNRETENLKLLEQEQKEVGIMLEKKVTCNGGSGTAASLVNVNGVDSLNHDSVNKTIKTASEATENGLEEFLPKVEATKTECDIKMNLCENKGSLVNSNNTSSNIVNGNKDITSGVMNNSCSNLSSNSCGTSGQEACQDGANVMVNGSNCPTTGNPKTSAQSMDNSQDATLPLLTDNRSEGSVSSNKENAPPSAVVNTTDQPPVSAISNMVCSTVSVPTLSHVQPLPSNMLNKSSVSMETQYMQQQSQIFVFSTTLANKAAETVISGHFPSIIAFHCNQPGTKRFLEKHPLKVHQFNRQNTSPWFNSLAQGKQNKQLKVGGVGPLPGSSIVNHQLTSGQPMCTGPCMVHGNPSCSISGGSSGWSGNPIGTSGLGPCGSSDMNPRPGVFHWGTHQQQGVLHGMNMNPHQKFQPHMSNPGQPSGMRPTVRGILPVNIGGPVGSNVSGCCSNPGAHYPGAPSEPCGTSQVQSSLTGVKIPDENLTPQQRQHREEQLAMIRKMQQWLFPDQQGNEVPPSSEPIMNSQGVMIPGGMGGHGCVSGTEMCPQPGMEMMCGQGCLMGDHHPHPSSDGGMYHVPSSMMGPQYPARQNVPPSSMAAQMEWQKLQQQFIEERQKKPSVSHPSPMGQQTQPAVNSPNPNVGMSPNTRVQGPPPPYPNPHRAMPSPHPSSPNLSMSSPRMPSVTSPTEPLRQFSHLTPPGSRMPHPSPGGGVNNSLHSTPMNSPKPPPSSSACNGQTSGNIRTSNSSSSNTASTVGPILPSFSPMGTNSSRKASGQQTSVSSLDINSTMMTNQTSVSSLTQSTSSEDVFSTNCGHHPCNSVPSCHKNIQNPEHTLQSGTLGKEASLMPVPSPQQIMYLNSFDGQELTIQKQPNTSLEADLIMSPARLSTDTSQSFPRSDGIQGPLPVSTMCGVPDNMNAQSYVSLQASLVDSNQPRYPLSNQMAGYDNNPRFINTPPQGVDLGMQRFAVPQNSSLEEMARMAGGGTLERFPSGISIGNGLRPSSSNMEGIQRFTSSNSSVEIMNRFRGPNSGVEMMQPRYPGVGTHLMGPDGIQPHPQFPPSGAETIQPHQYASPAQTLMSNESHSHLHSLQKMTPPFDIPPVVKLSSEIAQHGTVSQMCSGPPQLSYQHMGSQKLTHFDPLGSIAAMSDSAGSASSAVSQTQQSMMTTTMNMSSMHVSGNLGNNPNQPHVVNFNTSMQAIQGVQQSMTQQGGSDGAQEQQQYMGSQMAQNMGGGPQTVNNTYVNATMSIQQLNIQNVTTPTFSPTIHHPHSSVVQGQHIGAHTVSSSVTSNQSIAHSSVSQKPSVNMSGVGPRGPNQPQPFPGHPVGGQRMMSPLGAAMGQGMIAKHTGPAGIPYNTTNVHVKASAPNTIQYLPARPTVATPGSTRPPSLEFLQRFATPLTNLDAKVPTHNLQYFPGVTPINSNIGPSLGPSGPGQVMINTQRPVSIGAGAMLRGPPVSHQVITGGEMYPGPCGSGGNDPAMFGQPPRLQGNGMMSISGIGGGQGGGMFPGKQTQISPAGMADVSQPLQPSLGHSMNYKHSPLYAPTTADPNYAVQFHNFQQQLYATNTRGSQSSMSSGQTFFGPK